MLSGATIGDKRVVPGVWPLCFDHAAAIDKDLVAGQAHVEGDGGLVDVATTNGRGESGPREEAVAGLESGQVRTGDCTPSRDRVAAVDGDRCTWRGGVSDAAGGGPAIGGGDCLPVGAGRDLTSVPRDHDCGAFLDVQER